MSRRGWFVAMAAVLTLSVASPLAAARKTDKTDKAETQAATDRKEAERSDEAERLERARVAFQEIRDMKDENIPGPLMERAKCVAVFPGMVKGALGWGARIGKGVLSCRDASGHWGAPVFLTVKGGSFGLQIGVEKADVVLFFMTDRSARSLMESKFTLGGKAGLAAGPVGRTAEAATDLKPDVEIYSYARSKGVLAGISLEGARVAPDDRANRRYYGATADAKRMLREHKAPSNPPEARAFVAALP